MRLLNDKTDEREAKRGPKGGEDLPMDFLGVLVHTAYATLSFGCAGSALTVFFVPLPMIANHLRLTEPWPKVTALLGAVIALVVLGMPVEVVTLIFIAGLIVGDGVRSGRRFWALGLLTSAVSLATAVGLLSWNARNEGTTLGAYWTATVGRLVEGYAELEFLKDLVSGDVLAKTLLYEGPFFFLAGILMCVWISVGAAAHLGWFPPRHPLSPGQLRRLRLPTAVSVAFLVLLLARFLPQEPYRYLVEGAFVLVSAVLLIQGCAFLSTALEKKKLSGVAKIVVYVFSLTFGSYALMGLGVMGPYLPLFSNGKKLEDKR